MLYSRFSFVIYFTYSINSVYISIPISQFIPPHLPPWYPYVCSLCLCLYFFFVNKIVYTIFFRFHIYVLIIYDICFSLSDFLHSVWQSLGSIYTMEFYSAIKRNEIGSFVEMWMDLETALIFLRLLEALAFPSGYPASAKLLDLLSTSQCLFLIVSQLPLTLAHLTWLTTSSFKKLLPCLGSSVTPMISLLSFFSHCFASDSFSTSPL